jgi:alpha-glucosidase (family GH31 glycosyl hydrolase)
VGKDISYCNGFTYTAV